MPPAMSGARNRMSAILAGVLGLGYIIGVTVYLVSWIRRAARVLDSALTPLGLTSQPYMVVGRRYRGMIEGRAIEVQFLPAYGFTRALLNLTIGANLRTRMAIGRRIPWLDCGDCARLDTSGLGLKDLCVVAEDGERARSLLVDPEVSAVLVRLLLDRGSETREVYVQPDRVWMRVRFRGRMAEAVAHWLDDLRNLAHAGECVFARSSQ